MKEPDREMNDKLHKIMFKSRYNMPVVYFVRELDKHILNIVSGTILENDKLVIQNFNLVSNTISNSLIIQSKYNKVYKI